jgi:hypothetical protein
MHQRRSCTSGYDINGWNFYADIMEDRSDSHIVSIEGSICQVLQFVVLCSGKELPVLTNIHSVQFVHIICPQM